VEATPFVHFLPKVSLHYPSTRFAFCHGQFTIRLEHENMTAILEEEQQLEVSELVAAARLGDHRAISELYDRFYGLVMSIARDRLGDWHEADDLCQDAFFQAFRKLDQLHCDAAFPGWLQQIVVRMAINKAVRRARLANIDQEILANTLVDDGEAYEDAVRSEEAKRVWEGLARLRTVDRETLVAFYIDGQSLLEMSDRFAAPLGTIKRRLHTARARLAKECEILI
jgi:RNA polymerase sigma-70 factor (ECF subfamily)